MKADHLTVRDHWEHFQDYSFPSLFVPFAESNLPDLLASLESAESSEVLFEADLLASPGTVGLSVLMSSGQSDAETYRLETRWEGAICHPFSLFRDTSSLTPDSPPEEMNLFLNSLKVPCFPSAASDALLPPLQRLLGLLPRHAAISRLGIIPNADSPARIRVHPSGLFPMEAAELLRELGWTGNPEELKAFLREIEPYSVKKDVAIEFDLSEEGLASSVSVRIDLASHTKKILDAWLDYLTEKGLCRQDKIPDLLDWAFLPPQPNPFLINDISHFSFGFDSDITSSRVFLRQGNVPYRTFGLYTGPALINLELTDRCPLQCPQCYCQLNHGQDMPPDTALYWIRDAAKNHVRTVNLSGGETLLYAGLENLIRECHALGMEANIAISGWGATEERLRSLIEAGVNDICVSLNGPTEEVNRLTRDGYGLAIRALKTLQSLEFSRTCVNWVMHSSNADSFSEMIALAERYRVKEIYVILFKPNAAHELLTVPSPEQIRAVAKTIRSYQGPVELIPEPCFSPLRALLYGKDNWGVSRGCGAGRDGISVTAGGLLTPCRHLECPEAFASIQDYWEQSDVLLALRTVEASMTGPCRLCPRNDNCLPCAAISYKLRGELRMGSAPCLLGNPC